MMPVGWGSFQGVINNSSLPRPPCPSKNKVIRQLPRQMLNHRLHLLCHLCHHRGEMEVKWQGESQVGEWPYVTSRKNAIFPLPSQLYGCLGLWVYCLLNISSVHWEAERDAIVGMERGSGCTAVYVVRRSWDLWIHCSSKSRDIQTKGNTGGLGLL